MKAFYIVAGTAMFAVLAYTIGPDVVRDIRISSM
jgi:hypothetical protein